ncbi:MAG: hypothetical protein JWQ29_1909, partial [Phenylobacterium sp.]|nr:hypothetical protein [Phenylobacterium sp.]
MAKQWTVEALQALSVHQRADLYKNACRLGHTPNGVALKAMIEEAGLPFSESAALTLNDPLALRMYDVI